MDAHASLCRRAAAHDTAAVTPQRVAFHAYPATQRISELARAITGDTPPAALSKSTPRTRGGLQRAHIELGVSVG
jgi:hypothetical protein